MAAGGMRTVGRPISRSIASVGAVLVVAGASVSCGGGSSETSGPPSYSIVPSTPSIVPGAQVSFSVSGEEPVYWGLSESRSSRTSSPAYPLRVSTDGRYLVDQNDHPWRIQADAAWFMSSVATPDQVDNYLSTRRAQGFNSFYLMAMVHPGTWTEFAPDAPNNFRGEPPFVTPGDFSTAGATPESERYWQGVDEIIAKAADQGMAVMLAYTYLGYSGGDQGWWQEVEAQASRQVLFDWGVWLGERYKDTPNLIWFGLGDLTPPPGSEGALRVRAIAEGIRSTGATQPMMAEPSPPDGIPGEVPDFGDLVDMNSFYGYGPDGTGTSYLTADRAWRFSPTIPAWMQEGTYEYEDNTGEFSGEPWETRRGRFWAVLGGGTAGDGFGSKDVVRWKVPESLSTPGAEYSAHAFDLFAALPWWEMRPSGTDEGFAGVDLVPAGAGTWGELDYITSGLTADGQWLLAYVPVTGDGERTFTVDMSALSGPARARWFDPATGNYLAISNGFEYDPSGTRDFTTPGERDDGTDDWLLVLDSSGQASCGSITTSGVYTPPDVAAEGITCQVTATLQSNPSQLVRQPVQVGDG